MALEFERATNQTRHHGTHIGAGVGDHKILSTRFSHNAWVAPVHFEVFTDGLPQMTEHSGGTREVQSCKLAVIEHHVSCDWAVACHHVDDAVGETRLLENFHDDLGAVHLVSEGFHTTTLPISAATAGWKSL